MKRRWVRRVLWGGLALLGVGLVLAGVEAGGRYAIRRGGEGRLADVTAALDATDPGWRLDDILAAREAKFPPDDRNVMSLVRRVYPRIPDQFNEWSRRDPEWVRDPAANRLPPPDEAAAIARVRAACRDVIEQARLARQMTSPGGYHLPVTTNPLNIRLETTQNLRALIALLRLDALASVLAGDPDRAIVSTLAALTAARGLGDEPFAISLLVRVACTRIAGQTAERVLAWGEPRTGLAELQAALTAEADEPLLTVALRGERALFDRVFESVDVGAVSLAELTDSGRSPPDPHEVYATWVYRGHLPADRAAMLTTMTAYLDGSRRPPHEQPVLFSEVSRPPREFHYLLSGLLLPAIETVAGADWRVKADLRAAATGIACERFRQATGRWPADLAEVPKAILPEVPLDPYDGHPLRYRRTADGAVVYAVGPDKTDDGGNLSLKDEPGTDHGFRLWNPAHRRAAPPPEPKPDGDEPEKP